MTSQLLADTEAYHTLEDNLRRLGFERATNDKGQKLSWRWQTRTERGALMISRIACWTPCRDRRRCGVAPCRPTGTISVSNIPHSSIVFDPYQTVEIQAELLGGAGVASELVRHANLVSFTCLKAFAFDQRFERKDAHDLVYCIEHAPEGLDAAAAAFREALTGKHGAVLGNALEILRRRFCSDEKVEGYRTDGPVAVALFQHGEDSDTREARVCAGRQREASDLVERLLASDRQRLRWQRAQSL